jgi:hypothetical protein
MIKHSDSLASWLQEVANETYTDPLTYPEFKYKIKDFDNVPAVIIKFLFHLNNQLE